jgi:hypothetical protein
MGREHLTTTTYRLSLQEEEGLGSLPQKALFALLKLLFGEYMQLPGP